MSRGNGVKGHTRSGADDESRTRGLDHGVVALCQLSYIRKICEANLRPVPKFVSRQVVKEHPPAPDGVCGAIHRSQVCADAQAGSSQKTKRPGSFRNPGLCEQSLEGARLCAPLSRMQLVLVPIKLKARRQGQVQCTRATAERLHRRGSTHERDQPIHGSVGCDDVRGFHDESS